MGHGVINHGAGQAPGDRPPRAAAAEPRGAVTISLGTTYRGWAKARTSSRVVVKAADSAAGIVAVEPGPVTAVGQRLDDDGTRTLVGLARPGARRRPWRGSMSSRPSLAGHPLTSRPGAVGSWITLTSASVAASNGGRRGRAARHCGGGRRPGGRDYACRAGVR